MKLILLSCIVGILPYLVESNPQITQSCSGAQCSQNNVGNPAGYIAQNCVGAQCVQNNIGRRKREIVAEILAEAVDAAGREARSAPAGHGGHHAPQPHVPQVHVDVHIPDINIPDINIPDINIPDINIPDIIIPDINIPDIYIPEVHVPGVHVPSPQHHQPPQHHEISQNCADGQCNQNNIASSIGFSNLGSIAQKCVGASCNQNNIGRRKREVIAELIEEARKIAEEEVEAEEAISRKKRQISQNCVGGQCNQNNIASGGVGFSFPISQNCVGGLCNQNNLGRRKREIIASILNESS